MGSDYQLLQEDPSLETSKRTNIVLGAEKTMFLVYFWYYGRQTSFFFNMDTVIGNIYQLSLLLIFHDW